MTKVILERTPPTPAAVAVVIASLSPALSHEAWQIKWPEASYRIEEVSRTLGALSEATLGIDEQIDFSNEISSFYAKLLFRQVRLDPEFEKILDENAWELYVRD
jgi:hypothetical protein